MVGNCDSGGPGNPRGLDVESRALRWVGIALALVWPLVALVADITSDWQPGTEQVAIYVAGVLGLIGVAFGMRIKNGNGSIQK